MVTGTRRIAFDIETLDVTPNAEVLSIGAVWFDAFTRNTPEQLREQSVYFELKHQPLRDISGSTLDWWFSDKVSNAARAVLSAVSVNAKVPVTFAAGRLTAWADTLPATEPIKWYCRGPHFDATILMGLFGEKCPFKFWQVRDTRTYLEAFLPDYYDIERRLIREHGLVKHNALDDAILEAMLQQRSNEKFLLLDAPAQANAWVCGDYQAGEWLLEALAT
jgi:hypothetical protein